MNFKKTLVSAVIAAAALTSGQASASSTLFNWQFDADGNSLTGSRDTINEFFDLLGSALVRTTDLGTDPLRTFTEKGVFNFTAHDTGLGFGSFAQDNQGRAIGEITAIFESTGDVTLGGDAQFKNGSLKLYSDNFGGGTKAFGQNDGDNAGANTTYYGSNDGINIAEFKVLFGSVDQLNPNGAPTNNSNVEITFEKINMLPNYFFAPDGITDLSTSAFTILFGFATTDATNVTSLNSELQQELEDLNGMARGTYINSAPAQFVISNNGQFRLATIPEPSSIFLLGIGLLGFVMKSRKA